VIAGIGVDACEVDRIRRVLAAPHGARFRARVFTDAEQAYCESRGRGRVESYAARFAAKEAVMKALGTGARGVAWREIEVLPNRRGKPLVYLHGSARERAARIGLDGLDVSLSHSRRYAVAFVVAGRNSKEPADREAWRGELAGILRERGWLE